MGKNIIVEIMLILNIAAFSGPSLIAMNNERPYDYLFRATPNPQAYFSPQEISKPVNMTLNMSLWDQEQNIPGLNIPQNPSVNFDKKTPFGCTEFLCNKYFKSKILLETHLRNHAAEKGLSCKFVGCRSYFSSVEALHAHQSEHEEEKCRYLPQISVLRPKFAQSLDINGHVSSSYLFPGDSPHISYAPPACAPLSYLPREEVFQDYMLPRASGRQEILNMQTEQSDVIPEKIAKEEIKHVVNCLDYPIWEQYKIIALIKEFKSFMDMGLTPSVDFSFKSMQKIFIYLRIILNNKTNYIDDNIIISLIINNEKSDDEIDIETRSEIFKAGSTFQCELLTRALNEAKKYYEFNDAPRFEYEDFTFEDNSHLNLFESIAEVDTSKINFALVPDADATHEEITRDFQSFLMRIEDPEQNEKAQLNSPSGQISDVISDVSDDKQVVKAKVINQDKNPKNSKKRKRSSENEYKEERPLKKQRSSKKDNKPKKAKQQPVQINDLQKRHKDILKDIKNGQRYTYEEAIKEFDANRARIDKDLKFLLAKGFITEGQKNNFINKARKHRNKKELKKFIREKMPLEDLLRIFEFDDRKHLLTYINKSCKMAHEKYKYLLDEKAKKNGPGVTKKLIKKFMIKTYNENRSISSMAEFHRLFKAEVREDQFVERNSFVEHIDNIINSEKLDVEIRDFYANKFAGK